MIVTGVQIFKKIAISLLQGLVVIPGIFATIDLGLPDVDFKWLEQVNVFGKTVMSGGSIVYGLVVVAHKVQMNKITRDKHRESLRKDMLENDLLEQSITSNID